VIGHYGDKIGRKSMLVLTLLVMGVATFLIGLLPTYAQIGPWAAVLLVVLRVAQGFGVGGEWGGAVLMAVEHAPAGRRGFYGSFPQIGVPAGLVLSTAVFSIFSRMPADQFYAWGWRVPFLVSALLVAVGVAIRTRTIETPAFAELKASATVARQPILEVVLRHPKQVLLAAGARMAENGAFYIYSVFVLAYATTQVKMPQQTILGALLLAAGCEVVAIPLYGALSDRIGRRPVYLFGALMTAVLAYPLFVLLDSGSTAWTVIAMLAVFLLAHAPMYGPQAAFLAEMFGPRVRYSGASLGAQLSSVVAGGLSPFVAGALLRSYGRNAIVLYLMVLAALTIAAVAAARETGGRQ